MNNRIKWMIGVAMMAVCAAMASWIGYRMGEERAKGLCRGTLVLNCAALQELRRGNAAEAMQSIECHWYSDAVILLESPKWRRNSTVKTFMPEMVAYRAEFAGSSTNWTPAEQRLEELLKQQGWKK